MSIARAMQFFHIPKNKIPHSNVVSPIVIDCAALSNDVYYNTHDPHRPPLPTNWHQYARYECHGYVGVCYLKCERGNSTPTQIAFAHRGTVFDLRVLKSDLEIALNSTPGLFTQAAAFTQTTFDRLLNEYGDKLDQTVFIQTGHSLGGVLAEMVSGGNTKTITFENPGSKPLIEEVYRTLYRNAGFSNQEIDTMLKGFMALLKNNCQTYLADVNFINTCNEQVGTTWRLSDLPYHYDVLDGPILNIESKYYLNPHYFAYSIDQHHIDQLYNYLKENGRIEPASYPFGFTNGYVAYLDGEVRKRYWEGYFETLWQMFPGLQEDYHHDYEKFHQFWQAQLKRTQLEAMENKNKLPEAVNHYKIPASVFTKLNLSTTITPITKKLSAQKPLPPSLQDVKQIHEIATRTEVHSR